MAVEAVALTRHPRVAVPSEATTVVRGLTAPSDHRAGVPVPLVEVEAAEAHPAGVVIPAGGTKHILSKFE